LARAPAPPAPRCGGTAGPPPTSASRYPHARVYADYDELLGDDELDAIVVATPVATHYELARSALEAGKHVLGGKPPAMRPADMEERVALPEAPSLALMPGHRPLYH